MTFLKNRPQTRINKGFLAVSFWGLTPNKKMEKESKKIFSSSLLKIILIILIIWLVFYSGRELYWYLKNKKELKKIQEQEKSLIKENDNLSETLKEVDSPEFIEREAKERLGLQKEGEKVIIVVPEKND